MRISELKKSKKGLYGTIYTHPKSDRAISYSTVGLLAKFYVFNGTYNDSLEDAFDAMKKYVGAPE